MEELIRSLLKFNKLGGIIFDNKFSIIHTNRRGQKILEELGPPQIGDNLLDVVPEFIGSESVIQDVISRRAGNFAIEYVNRRTVNERTLRYLNLLILPYTVNGQGFLAIDDVTEQATLLQQRRQQQYELLLYKTHADFRRRFLGERILGQSPPIQKIREIIRKLARVPTTTILLLGETGVGKNLAARVIHYSSMPAEAPFIDINCAALPEHLIESELFGYKKGAFTHAIESRAGLFKEAAGGTLFLDEIGEMPLNMQAKLLTALETRRFRPLGSNRSIELKARIIAATNRGLQAAVSQKQFREDLYYRLNVVSITLPPLREMGRDILLVAEHFLQIFSIEFNKKVKGFTPRAIRRLCRHTWPGNVRELSNCLERAMIFIESDRIHATDLVLPSSGNLSGQTRWAIPAGGTSLKDVERQLIGSALERAGGNISKAARLLGLSRNTLRYRLQKYNLQPD